MSDLSWHNPTPHAIAVYASRPLSPVATQHSLLSGRYSLLGPDFHRLDRTSLRLGPLLHSPAPSAGHRGESVTPSAFAVLRLIARSNLVGPANRPAWCPVECGRYRMRRGDTNRCCLCRRT